jgi:hypothetical protein
MSVMLRVLVLGSILRSFLRTESMFREKNEDLQPCGIETIKLRTVK